MPQNNIKTAFNPQYARRTCKHKRTPNKSRIRTLRFKPGNRFNYKNNQTINNNYNCNNNNNYNNNNQYTNNNSNRINNRGLNNNGSNNRRHRVISRHFKPQTRTY